MRAASQGREGSTKGGGGEDSAGRRGGGAGSWAGGAWIGGKWGRVKRLPCRGRGGGEGDFGAGMAAQDEDPVSTGDSSPDRALCVRTSGKERPPGLPDLGCSPPSPPFC